jgi:hypothetical protein
MKVEPEGRHNFCLKYRIFCELIMKEKSSEKEEDLDKGKLQEK